MPRKSKVTAVSINQPEGLIRAQMRDEELMTDAQHMTEIAKVIDAEPSEAVQAEVAQEPDVQEEEPTVKPKAKRAPRVKKEAVVEPVIEEQSNDINEIVVEVELPQEDPKVDKQVDPKVECPDCGKKMSAKTLRYSHGPNCLFRKQADKEYEAMTKIPDEVIEAEVQKRIGNAKAERLSRRQKQIESLVANAF